MIHHVCAVYDAKAEAYNRPYYVPAIGIAMRSFQTEVNRKEADNPLHTNSEDFTLHQLGTFEDYTGEFANNRKLLAAAKDLRHD